MKYFVAYMHAWNKLIPLLVKTRKFPNVYVFRVASSFARVEVEHRKLTEE